MPRVLIWSFQQKKASLNRRIRLPQAPIPIGLSLPEQRIARIRAEAEASNGSLGKQVAFANQDKDFRSVQPQGAVEVSPHGSGCSQCKL